MVFHARSGTVTAQQTAVNKSVANVASLPHVIKAVSPFASGNSGAVSKSGTIAYASVSWSVNPSSLDTAYLNRLNKAVAPATQAGLQVEYGGGAGQIGQMTQDRKSEIIGLSCALVLLLFMFGSVIAAAIPLVSAIFSVGAGLSLLGVLASATTFPTTRAYHRHPARARGRGRLRPVPGGQAPGADGHRDGCRRLRGARRGTSGAAIVVAGSTVVVSILGLYVSGVAFVGALGLAAAIVVAITMLAALTLVPAFMGAASGNVRVAVGPAARPQAGHAGQEQAPRTAAATARAARAQRVRPVGPEGERAAVAVGRGQRRGAGDPRDPAVLDHARPARQRHEPDIATATAGPTT